MQNVNYSYGAQSKLLSEVFRIHLTLVLINRAQQAAMLLHQTRT